MIPSGNVSVKEGRLMPGCYYDWASKTPLNYQSIIPFSEWMAKRISKANLPGILRDSLCFYDQIKFVC